ncbi:nucleotide sugar dehydrogenase [Natronorarus salvus]|uniref:nucleotide sugar dehydrogenase n=1 Tax=Natronorarus salvus TaxID=3117733 RepID=UPI002F26841B
MSETTSVTRLYGSDEGPDEQRRAFLAGRVPVGVYGLGKMGLPLAAVFADVCRSVIGVDVDPAVVAATNAGRSHVDHEPGLDDLVERTVERGALSAVGDPAVAAREAVVHVVVVPTLLTRENAPDLSALETTLSAVASGLRRGDLVVVESTVPPLTCRDDALPLLEAESGLSRGEFGLGFCPERTQSGRALADIRGAYPKVVGGVDEESARAAALVYGEITDNEVIRVSSARVAEAVKVFEGVYRDVNIALANELAGYGDRLGVDAREAIAVANTQPFCDIHTPGPGVGGHCIPYYPYFLLDGNGGELGRLLRTARSVNDGMPKRVVETLSKAIVAEGRSLPGTTVAVLGLTYRPGIAETRATPARPIARLLAERGARVLTVDPVLGRAEASGFHGERVTVEELHAHDLDAAVLVTAHAEFETIDWGAFDELLVVDGRDALALDGTGHRVYTIGRGWS